jgi:hypothetical protein
LCVTTKAGCCYVDQDCGANEECVNAECGALAPGAPPVTIPGVCKTRFATGSTQCWRDADCAHHCTGWQICPCNASCIVADTPGTCGP